MALWGIKDTKTASGTVSIATTGVVTGTSTAFTTEAKVGNTILANSVEYQIISITSDTVAKVLMGKNNGNGTVTAQTSQSYTLSEKPAYVPHESATSTTDSGDSSAVFGVDSTEAAVSTNIAKGINTPGWVRYRTYTDSEGKTRNKVEVLVAGNGSSTGFTVTNTGDAADDATVADRAITIGTQPTSVTGAATPYTGTFTVAATVTNSGTLTYNWQVSTNSGSTWANASGGVYSNNTTATLTLTSAAKATYNGYQYRCQVSATGANTVTSTAATLAYA
jgi:hypothetical protein